MIAIITGASAGLGREFAHQIVAKYPEIDTLWLISRRISKLEDLAAELPEKKTVCIGMDLTNTRSFSELNERLSAEHSEVGLLINNAGCGYLGNIASSSVENQKRMVDLNVRALTMMTSTVLPYMKPGGRIINVSSVSSFCPNPGLTVYSASKSYVSAFTAALADELKNTGITVTAIFPGPMDTEFHAIAGTDTGSMLFKRIRWCDTEKVAEGALDAAKRGHIYFTPTFYYKLYRVLAKVLPQKWLVPRVRA